MNRIAIPAVAMALVLTGHAWAAPVQATPLLPQPLSASDLADLSGGSSIALTNQNLNALNAGNQVNGDTINTGDINVPDGAFKGFNGVGNFVFNTGNNNNVQGTLSVTILTPTN